MKNKKKLIVISGPSGVGKGVVIKQLLQDLSCLELAVSATTRPIRSGEVNKKDYYFLTNIAFDEAITNDSFIEYCDVHGNRYGTLKEEVERINSNNKIGLVEIDTQGAKKIKTSFPEILSIFIAPPTLNDLRVRLEQRQTESSEEIQRRVTNAEEELKKIQDYDFVVINDTIQNSRNEIITIITKTFNL